MKQLDEIRRYTNKYAKEHQNGEKILAVVEKSKQAFSEYETNHSLSYGEFIYLQGRYIHKRWWVLQGILLIVLWLILQITDSSFYIQRSMGILAPLFAILIVPEIWKNRNFASMEIECSAYYSLRQVYAARMVLFAIVDLLILSLFCVTVIGTGSMTIADMLIQFFIPFNVTCCICFRTLCNSRVGSQYLTLLFGMAWIALWVLIILNERVYSVVATPIWGGLLIGSILYMVYSIKKAQRSCESIWEENPSWN